MSTRGNGRPTINASEMRPDHLDLSSPWTFVCRDCGRWRSRRRSRITPHRARPDDPAGQLCPGSGQRVYVDLDPGEWARRRVDGLGEVAKIKAPGTSDPTWAAVSARL